MKKRIIIPIIISISGAICASAEAIEITVNGQSVKNEAIIVNDRTLVSVRDVFTDMGFTVEWNENTSTAVLTDRINEIVIPSDTASFTANGKEILPDVPQQIINNELYLPLRAVSEAARANVSWNSGTVKIQYNPDAVIPQSSDGLISAAINEIDTTNSVIYFQYPQNGADRLVLNEEKDYKIYLDNEEIPIYDLQEYDILSIAYDTSGEFDESEKYTIYVSRDRIEGRLLDTDYNSYPPVYNIDSKPFVSLFETDFELETKVSYDFYLDVFGRVVNVECMGSWGIESDYGILDSVSCDENGQYYAEIIPIDGSGTKKFPLCSEYMAKQASGILYDERYGVILYSERYGGVNGENVPIYKLDVLTEGTKKPVNQLCIQYALNRAGDVARISLARIAYYPRKESYDAESHMLGSYQIDSEHTIIMDLSEYDKSGTYHIINETELVDGKVYTFICKDTITTVKYIVIY